MPRSLRLRHPPRGLVPVASFLLACAPLFVLTVPRWSNAVLFTGAFLSVLLLWSGALAPARLDARARGWATAVVVALCAPILAVALSALLRRDAYPAPFDAPSRFLLGIPLFLFVLRARPDPARILPWVLPASLLVSLLSVLFGREERYPQGRDTNIVVDPLVFGYLSLAFGLMCLISITPRLWRDRDWAGLLLRVAGVLLGFYLSLRSGSRTGWVAVPVVVGAWLYLHWGRGHPVRSALVLLAAAAAPVLAYFAVPTVNARVNEAWFEIASYTWTGVAPFNSVALRITFLRVAADSFALHPFAGWGDTSRMPMSALPTFPYASPEALEGAFHAAFHNQVVSNAVRYGVGGLLATAALLLVPLALCLRQLRHGNAANRQNAAMGFAYTACIVLSSLSTEVVDLKFLASFYAVMVALLCGAALAEREPPTGPAS